MSVGSTFGGFGAFGSGSKVKTIIVLTMEGNRIVERKVIRTGETMDRELGRKPTAAIQRTRASLGMLLRDMVRLRTIIPTLAKAFISGIGITLLFGGLFIVLGTIRAALRGIFTTIASGIEAVGNFQKATLGLTALLSTFFEFSSNQAENFRIAGGLARELQEELIRRNKESIANIEQLQLSLQAALGAGLGKFVRTGREAVDVIILLSNAIASVTTGMDQTRQLQQEVRGLFSGTLKDTNQLAKILNDVIPGGIKQLLADAEKGKDLAQRLGEFLGGFAIASEQFGRTLEGIKTTFQSILILFQLQVFEKVTNRLLKSLSDFAALLQGDLAPQISRIAVRLSFAFDNALAKFIQVVSKGESFEGFLKRLTPIIDRISDGLVGVADQLAKLFLFLLARALDVLELISKGQLVSALVTTLETGAEAIGRIIARAFFNELKETATGVGGVLARGIVPGRLPEDELTNLEKILEKLLNVLSTVSPGATTIGGIPAGQLKTLLREQGDIFAGLKIGEKERPLLGRLAEGAVVPDLEALKNQAELTKAIEDAVKNLTTFVIGLDDAWDEYLRGTTADTEVLATRLKAVNAELESLRDTLASALRKTARGPVEASQIRQRELILNFFRDLDKASESAGFRIRATGDELSRMVNLVRDIAAAEALKDIERLQQRASQFAIRQAEREANRLSDIANARLALAKISVQGFQRTLTIEETVTRNLRAATRQVKALTNDLNRLGADREKTEAIEKRILFLLGNQAIALRRQLEFEQRIRESRQLQQRFALERQGIRAPGLAPVGLQGLIAERRRLRNELSGDDFIGPRTEKNILAIANQLQNVELQLRGVFREASSVSDLIGGAMIDAFVNLIDTGGGVKAFFQSLKESLEAVKEVLISAIGQGFANAIQGLIQGTSSFGQAIGGMIISLGNLAIAMGTVMVLGAFFLGGDKLVLGIALIAAGVGMIALGTIMGGSGPQSDRGAAGGTTSKEVPTFTFQQEQVNVQQGQAQVIATSDLRATSENFRASVERLDSMPAGDVVVVGNEQKGGAAKILSKSLRSNKSIVAGRQIAINLRGN